MMRVLRRALIVVRFFTDMHLAELKSRGIASLSVNAGS